MNSIPVDISTAIDIVTKVVSKLSQNSKKKSKKCEFYGHIDIEVITHDNYSWVQILNNGEPKLTLRELVTVDFNDPTLNGKLLGTVIQKSESNEESTYVTHFDGTLIQLNGAQTISHAGKFSHLKDYLSIKIQHPFKVSDMRPFVDQLVQHLRALQLNYPQTKYTLRFDKKTFYNNYTELDDDYAKCKILSSAIETIVLQSVNEGFRKEVCNMLEIPHVNDTFDALMSNLLPTLHNNYQV